MILEIERELETLVHSKSQTVERVKMFLAFIFQGSIDLHLETFTVSLENNTVYRTENNETYLWAEFVWVKMSEFTDEMVPFFTFKYDSDRRAHLQNIYIKEACENSYGGTIYKQVLAAKKLMRNLPHYLKQMIY